jgi:hypothetical protein
VLFFMSLSPPFNMRIHNTQRCVRAARAEKYINLTRGEMIKNTTALIPAAFAASAAEKKRFANFSRGRRRGIHNKCIIAAPDGPYFPLTAAQIEHQLSQPLLYYVHNATPFNFRPQPNHTYKKLCQETC